jgi:hypothetical protein
MLEEDYILLIMNCKKYFNKAYIQKNTWLPSIPHKIKYYHVVGDEELNEPFKFDNENKILWLKVPDDYNSLPKKVISAYQATYQTFKFKYIFKTDDDQMLVKGNFFDTLTKLLNDNKEMHHYGGYIVDVPKPYLSQYHRVHPELPEYLPVLKTKYCSGRFYFLSSDAISILITKREKISEEYLEDYAIGYNLPDMYKEKILSISTDKIFNDM